MPKAFISYARGDESAAKRLGSELEKRGIEPCWMDHLVAPGEPWVPQFEKAIASSDFFFILVSPESDRSPLIATEIAFAISHSQGRRPVVIPVLLNKRAEPPFLLQHLQGIELFDPERSQRQLDDLAQSLKRAPVDRGTLGREEDMHAIIRYIEASREALHREMAAEVSKRVIWSSTVTAAVSALAVVMTVLASFVSLFDATVEAVHRWSLPFGLGAVFSVVVTLLFGWFRRRISRRSLGEGGG